MQLFRRHVALPQDHGSWIFLIRPLLVGLVAGGRLTTVSLYLVVAAFAAFLIRQPVTLAVKAYSGRRGPGELPAAWFWIAVYSLVGLLHVTGLVIRGNGFVLWLALPGVPVFAWYLFLVSRRAERRQLLVEVLATGALSLAAPAAYWVGVGRPDPLGWLLWALMWGQSGASILHAYMRLGQRGWSGVPVMRDRLRHGAGALSFTGGNVAWVAAAGAGGILPAGLVAPYALQFLETAWCALRPVPGIKPIRVGLRQLAVSTVFTALFIIFWLF